MSHEVTKVKTHGLSYLWHFRGSRSPDIAPKITATTVRPSSRFRRTSVHGLPIARLTGGVACANADCVVANGDGVYYGYA